MGLKIRPLIGGEVDAAEEIVRFVADDFDAGKTFKRPALAGHLAPRRQGVVDDDVRHRPHEQETEQNDCNFTTFHK